MLRNLDTDLLRSFLAVAEANSFTKASELLFRTQAAVSLQIKRLEDQLGKSILIRGRRGLSLTPEGELLIDLEDRTVALHPRQGFVVPKGVTHRTRAAERTVILMVENAGIIPTGN